MKRRKFVSTTAAMATLAGLHPLHSCVETKDGIQSERRGILSCYYFRAHMYTMVPHQVREDLKWMADHGTNAVDVGILEQDFFAAVENVEIIANEASKLGMKLFIIPSRWAGIIAGAPKVPSLFAVHNPHTWLILPDGQPAFSKVNGVHCSIFYPEVAEFYKSSIDKAVDLWGIDGVIWDEPKIYHFKDHSKAAIEKVGENAPPQVYIQAFTDFWTDINTYIKEKHADVLTNLFLYADIDQHILENAASIGGLDYCGCDGRPWGVDDGGKNEHSKKTLLGSGERFLPAAKKNGKKSLWLVENHAMRDEDIALMDQKLPEVMEKEVDHLIYYYYPRNLQNPDKQMKLVGKHIKNYR